MLNSKKPLIWLSVIVLGLVLVLSLVLVISRLDLFSQKNSGGSKDKKLSQKEPKSTRKGKEMKVSNTSTVKVDGFKLTASTDKKIYKKGESVKIEFVTENQSSSEKTLSYPSAQEYNFWVRSEEGSEVWRWSEDKAFAMALQEVRIKPGERRAYDIVWSQKDLNEMQVPVGRYSVVAQSVAAELKDERVEVLIEIRE